MKEDKKNTDYDFDDVNIRIEQINLDDGEDILLYLPTEFMRISGYVDALIKNLDIIKEKSGRDLRFWILPEKIKVELLELKDTHDVILYAPNEYFSREGYMESLSQMAEQIKKKSGKDFGFWMVPDSYKLQSVDKESVTSESFVRID